jgi:hypothetical protein
MMSATSLSRLTAKAAKQLHASRISAITLSKVER